MSSSIFNDNDVVFWNCQIIFPDYVLHQQVSHLILLPKCSWFSHFKTWWFFRLLFGNSKSIASSIVWLVKYWRFVFYKRSQELTSSLELHIVQTLIKVIYFFPSKKKKRCHFNSFWEFQTLVVFDLVGKLIWAFDLIDWLAWKLSVN